MTSTREFTETNEDQREELERLRAEVAQWRARYEKGAKRDIAFVNSASEVAPVYTALDRAGADLSALGGPGS